MPSGAKWSFQVEKKMREEKDEEERREGVGVGMEEKKMEETPKEISVEIVI